MLDEIVFRHLADLGPTDQMIWKYIYNHRKQCTKMSIHELAAACNVSRTTILRFTRKISLEGFSELKALLKLEEKQRPVYDGASVIDEICSGYQVVMEDIRKKDFQAINKLIYEAKRIIAYGTGAIQSNVIREMKRLFLGSGDLIMDFEGNAEFEFISQILEKGDLLIIVSLSGETPSVVHRLEKLKLKEIPIICITRFEDNTIARSSTEKLFISTNKFNIYANESTTYPYTSMTVFYSVIEILFLQYQLYKKKRDH